MMMARRRFVNMVAEKRKVGLSSVHRLNVSEHLFYPSTADAEAAKLELSRLEALPAPTTSFQAAPSFMLDQHFFALLSPRSSESRILWGSSSENTLLFDLDSCCSQEMPGLRYKGYSPITISIPRPDALEEDLYVMSQSGNDSEVLRFGLHKDNPKLRAFLQPPETWQWHSLPPPPHLFGATSDMISTHAVLHDGRTICITGAPRRTNEEPPRSTDSTYLFDTVERKWSRAPYEWELPFYAGAEYVPDLKLWLGFADPSGGSSSHHVHLCTSADVSAAFDEGRPPTLTHQWEGGIATPEAWLTTKVSLINLGEGRFCIFKAIHDVFDKKIYEECDWEVLDRLPDRYLALLTGVEIKPCSPPDSDSDSQQQGGGGLSLKMVTHKSLYYDCGYPDTINWVL